MFEQKVKKLFAKVLETTADEIIDDNMAIYGLNSFKVLEFASELEKEFKILLPKDSFAHLISLNNTIRVVDELVQNHDDVRQKI